jgi:hypothetical protein
MVAKIVPAAYDIEGKKVSHLNINFKRYWFKPTFPMGTYLSQPLSVSCSKFQIFEPFYCSADMSLIKNSLISWTTGCLLKNLSSGKRGIATTLRYGRGDN